LLILYCCSKNCAMMSHLCNRCVREFLILARTLFALGLPSKLGVTRSLLVHTNYSSFIICSYQLFIIHANYLSFIVRSLQLFIVHCSFIPTIRRSSDCSPNYSSFVRSFIICSSNYSLFVRSFFQLFIVSLIAQ
jgi:hypothetical protein